MTGLRKLTVKLLPRLEYTWSSYAKVQCDGKELFSHQVPLTIEHFDSDLTVLGFNNTVNGAKIGDHIMEWLGKFPTIAVGDILCDFLVREHHLISQWCIPGACEYVEDFRHLCPSSLSIREAVLIHQAMTAHQDQDQVPSLVNLTEIMAKKVTTLVLRHTSDNTTDNTIDVLSQLYLNLPNVTVMVGANIRILPDTLTSYHGDVNLSSGNDVSIVARLPWSLRTLVLTFFGAVDFTEQFQLSLPPYLTHLDIRYYKNMVGTDTTLILVEDFHKLIYALPSTLAVLRIRISPDSISEEAVESTQCWPVKLVQALPRGLKEFTCSNYCWNTIDPILDQQCAKALPPSLTSVYCSGYYKHGVIAVLPSTLTSITIKVETMTLLLQLNELLHRFTSLKKLTLDLVTSELDMLSFPELILPYSLIDLKIGCYASSNIQSPHPSDVEKDVVIMPLHKFIWPLEMDSISISAYNPAVTTIVEQWILPARLNSLYISGDITVKELPTRWPRGLSKITSFAEAGEAGDDGEIWPNIAEKGVYFPDHTLCRVREEVGNGEGCTDFYQLTRTSDGMTSEFVSKGCECYPR